MNRRGQEFEGFRLLIEAIMVILILVMIMGIINRVDSMMTQVNEQRLYEGLHKAVNSPDGSVILEKDLVLKAGSTYSTRSFAQEQNMPDECFALDAVKSTAFLLGGDGKVLSINTRIQVSLYYKCEKDANECDIFCTVSFGKDLSEGE